MAMSFTFSNMIVHFHYLRNAKPQDPTAHLSQKATAKYALGYGTRKLPKTLYIRRIGVLALSDESKREEEKERPLSRTSSGEKERQLLRTSSGEKERQLLRTSSGEKAYYSEELEILTLLKKHVPVTSNLAEELRNKFGEIPEDRWKRLYEEILKPEHIPRIWDIAEKRYKDPSADSNSEAAMLLRMESKSLSPVLWNGKFNGVTWLSRLTGNFKMAFFRGNDGHVYGRVVSGKSFVRSISEKVRPLYFAVRNPNGVLGIVKPCDLALEFGDGQLQLLSLPESFPKPAKHPRTFNGQIVHIRSAGPNVLVGQAMKLDKVWGELVLVKDCAAKK